MVLLSQYGEMLFMKENLRLHAMSKQDSQESLWVV